jgi:pilus assembly protein CpaF
MENRFYIADRVGEEYLPVNVSEDNFKNICRMVKQVFDAAWRDEHINTEAALRIQKRAIIGYENEVAYFMERISQILAETGNSSMIYPSWYTSAASAVYHENWGMCGLAEWFSPRYKDSSSAKIIGDRVYFMENGKMVLRPQRISTERRHQMIRSFLLLSPEERLDREVHEIYLLDGTRVTIFNGSMTKPDQDVMVFRRYTVPVYRFEEQAARKTIPLESIPLFKSMVKLGYNVVFSGAVRTSKTSFLSTWQSYEDTSLEGVMLETDPEIRMHSIMPDAPVIQLIADDDKLNGIIKNLLRSDADYFIIAEARNGIAVDTAVKISSKGNRRLKMTFHEREPCDFCMDAAAEIVKSLGGDLHMTSRAVAKSFDYIFHFIQLKDKSQKRLKSIYEISYDEETNTVNYHQLCRYNVNTDSWKWAFHISEDKKNAGLEEDAETFMKFSSLLEKLGGNNVCINESRIC